METGISSETFSLLLQHCALHFAMLIEYQQDCTLSVPTTLFSQILHVRVVSVYIYIYIVYLYTDYTNMQNKS
jgi:hypothetical protein